MQFRQEVKVMKAIFCVLFVGFLVAGTLVPMPAAASSCDLAFFNGLGLPNTTFTSPTRSAYAIRNPGVYPQTSPVNHCEVIGYINPRTGIDGKPYAIGFHLRLPDAWNGRFYFQGGGGTDGNLGDALGGNALSLGYAVVSTDAGHDNTINKDDNAGGTASFGVDPQARIDYGYNALDQVTQTAKTIISKYYAARYRVLVLRRLLEWRSTGDGRFSAFPDVFQRHYRWCSRLQPAASGHDRGLDGTGACASRNEIERPGPALPA